MSYFDYLVFCVVVQAGFSDKKDLTEEMGGKGVVVFKWFDEADDATEEAGDIKTLLLLLLMGKYLESWCLMAASWAAGFVESEAKTILSS